MDEFFVVYNEDCLASFDDRSMAETFASYMDGTVYDAEGNVL